MDAKHKRSQAEKVRRQVTHQLQGLGFRRTKTSFWTRLQGPVIEFVHLHLFSFMPAFRVHPGIRVLNDGFEAPALNGPASADSKAPTFDASQSSILACASSIRCYCEEVAEPWFTRWRDPQFLLAASDSPLDPDARAALRAALVGSADQKRERKSRIILGVA
jgi:hypothetical protein